ncbi:MAG: hypothetical protein ACON49_07850 [Candidatus Puniceispirillaceae bacterium]
MKTVMKTIIASSFLTVAASSGALANAITAWSCEKTDTGQTVKLTTQSAVSSSAVINIDGAAQSGAVTVDGTTASIDVATSVQCWAVTFTITDGGSTFGLN